jgi:pseudaminic acid synthase
MGRIGEDRFLFMGTFVTADMGSSHGGCLKSALILARGAKWSGADAIKIQLWSDPKIAKAGNIEFPYSDVGRLKQYCDDLELIFFASVWDEAGYEALLKSRAYIVKFAYSQRHNPLIEQAKRDFKQTMVSYDYWDVPVSRMGLVRLYCHALQGQAIYPVTHKLDFSGSFFERFEGYSSHDIGWFNVTSAVKNGARYIERHIKHEHKIVGVPDEKFALTPQDFKKLIGYIKKSEPIQEVK